MTDQHVTQPGSDEQAMEALAAGLTDRHIREVGGCSETHYPEAYRLRDFLAERGYRLTPTQPEPSGERLRAALIGLLNALNVYERNWLTSSTGYRKVYEAQKNARAALAATPSPEQQEQEALRHAVDVLYGLRNHARHEETCRFTRTYDGIEANNQPCDCGFDEVEDAYDEIVDKALAALSQPEQREPPYAGGEGEAVHWRNEPNDGWRP